MYSLKEPIARKKKKKKKHTQQTGQIAKHTWTICKAAKGKPRARQGKKLIGAREVIQEHKLGMSPSLKH